MGIHNKISPGYAYYLTITVVEWIDLFSRPVYKHLTKLGQVFMTSAASVKAKGI